MENAAISTADLVVFMKVLHKSNEKLSSQMNSNAELLSKEIKLGRKLFQEELVNISKNLEAVKEENRKTDETNYRRMMNIEKKFEEI